jgi:nicotinamidase-related amidase
MSEFLTYLAGWHAGLAEASVAELVAEAGGPAGAAVFCVDVTVGFCREGALSSPRVGGIVAPVRELMVAANAAGVTRFYLPQDCHPADSPEFADFPPHCVAGTAEAEVVPELASLPFAERFVVIEKRSVASHAGTLLDALLDRDGLPALALVVGDCTDICVYQLAIHLRARGNAAGVPMRVVVPEDCVQTYDLPVEAAGQVGAMPHDGDLLHRVFLWHMALNGVEVYARLTG